MGKELLFLARCRHGITTSLSPDIYYFRQRGQILSNRGKTVRIMFLLIPFSFTACNQSSFNQTVASQRQGQGLSENVVSVNENGEVKMEDLEYFSECKTQSEFEGINVIFLIDNSGSMLETDCSIAERNDLSDSISSCGVTQRESAILRTFDILTYASKKISSSS